MLARILTENKDYNGVLAKTMLYFPGATFIKADGIWHSVVEHSLIIELLIDETEKSDVQQLAYEIKKMNKQEAVMVQYFQCESKLV